MNNSPQSIIDQLVYDYFNMPCDEWDKKYVPLYVKGFFKPEELVSFPINISGYSPFKNKYINLEYSLEDGLKNIFTRDNQL